MSFFSLTNLRSLALPILIIVFACLPIWTVDQFINQDGSPHLYNAYLIVELIKGNSLFNEIYSLNSAVIPNLTGHYMMAMLMLLWSPPVVTKIIVTFTFAGLAASVGWLRFQTNGREGLPLALLIGTALAFNWMWLLGFYNFIIGVIGFAFTLGLYWRWRENLNLWRSLILSFLTIFVFFSHLISFGMLVGSMIVAALTVASPNLKRSLGWTAAAIFPALPFVVGYKLTTEAGGNLFPVWRYLSNPLSPSNWILQLQTADPFQILTRKGFPLLAETSGLFAVFSPFLWIALAFICLSVATWQLNRRSGLINRSNFAFLIITLGSIFFWVFAPDDFGKTHGSFLRERVLLCGLICLVPLIRVDKFSYLTRAAVGMLAFVIFFQTFALWEFALTSQGLAKEYLAAEKFIKEGDRIGAVKFIENGCRFKANPLSNLNVLYGVGKPVIVWDNYEIGFYLFPVMAKSPQDRQFAYDFHESSSYELCDPNEKTADKLNQLNALMNSEHERVNVLLIWNAGSRSMPFLESWYQPTPEFENGRLSMFRHR